MVDDGGEAAVAAVVTLCGPANLLGEVGLQVGSEDDEGVVVLSEADVDLLPAGHDVGVVGCNYDELVDALLLWKLVRCGLPLSESGKD